MDIVECPYCRYCNELGIPELTHIFAIEMTIHMVIFQVFFSGVRRRWDAEMPAVIFILKKWTNLSNVDIIYPDYGEAMLAQAKAHLAF